MEVKTIFDERMTVLSIIHAIIDDIVGDEICDLHISRIYTGDEAVDYTYSVNVDNVYDITVNVIYDVVCNISYVGTCSAFIHNAPSVLHINSLCFVYVAETHDGSINLVNSGTGETVWEMVDMRIPTRTHTA